MRESELSQFLVSGSIISVSLYLSGLGIDVQRYNHEAGATLVSNVVDQPWVGNFILVDVL